MADPDPIVALFGPALGPAVKAVVASGGLGAVLLALSRMLASGDRRLDEARDLRDDMAERLKQISTERDTLASENRQLRLDLITLADNNRAALVACDEKYMSCREERAKALADLAVRHAELEELRSSLRLMKGATPETVEATYPPGVTDAQIEILRAELDRRRDLRGGSGSNDRA